MEIVEVQCFYRNVEVPLLLLLSRLAKLAMMMTFVVL
jgi:hypothetical protein